MRQLRKRMVSRVELIAVACGLVTWTLFAARPDDVAIVPEYIAAANALLLMSIAVTCAVLARQAWRWLRWWSVPISAVLFGIASLPALLIAGDLIEQLRPPPSEGFMYRGGMGVCVTLLVSTSASAIPGDRLYVLEQRCIPDGLENRATYVRQGSSLFMHKRWFAQ